MFVCHAIAAATGRSHRAHRARAATGTRARAATGMGHRPRDDRRTRSAAAGAGRRGRAQGQGAGAGCSGRVQRQSAAAGRSGEQWRRDGCVCHVTAALVRAQPQEHRAQGGCTGMRASGAGAHLRTVERPSRRSRRSARRRHRRSPRPGPAAARVSKVGSGWQEKKKVEHEPRPGGWAPQPDEREQGAAVISACTPPRAWARADAVPRVPAVPADGPRACARSPALPPSRARYHQLWCEYRVHLLNSHVFGAAAIAEGTDVRRRCLRPRAGGAPLPAPCAQRAARAGDGHQGQGAKGKSEGRVSRGAPGRAQPRCCLMHRMARPWQGADPRGGGGHDLEIEASSQPFNVPAPNTLSS